MTETTDVVKRLNPAVERFRARMAQVIAFVPLASVALLASIISRVCRVFHRQDASTLEQARTERLYC